MKYIWVKGKKSNRYHRYYYYDTFKEKREAVKTAKWYRKKIGNKCRYTIIRVEKGIFAPEIRHALYMTHVCRLSLI